MTLATRRSKPGFRLAHAVVLLLLLMLPVMLLLGAAEGRPGGPTLLFWLLLLLPMLLVPWLLTCCEPEETADGPRVAARRLPRDDGVSVDFVPLVAPLVRSSRSYVEDGVPVVEGIPQVRPEALFSELERRLAPYRITPLVEALDGGAVRIVGLPRQVETRLRSRSPVALNIVLFLATVLTTVYAGARQRGVNLLEDPTSCSRTHHWPPTQCALIRP